MTIRSTFLLCCVKGTTSEHRQITLAPPGTFRTRECRFIAAGAGAFKYNSLPGSAVRAGLLLFDLEDLEAGFAGQAEEADLDALALPLISRWLMRITPALSAGLRIGILAAFAATLKGFVQFWTDARQPKQ